MPYWNEIPGGGKGRPLTERETSFLGLLLKIFLVAGITGAILLMAIFLWPPLVLFCIVAIVRKVQIQKQKKVFNGSPGACDSFQTSRRDPSGQQTDFQQQGNT